MVWATGCSGMLARRLRALYPKRHRREHHRDEGGDRRRPATTSCSTCDSPLGRDRPGVYVWMAALGLATTATWPNLRVTSGLGSRIGSTCSATRTPAIVALGLE